MYFFSGKLGAYERMMTQKPGFNRRSGKSGKSAAQKKPQTQTAAEGNLKKRKDENHDG